MIRKEDYGGTNPDFYISTVRIVTTADRLRMYKKLASSTGSGIKVDVLAVGGDKFTVNIDRPRRITLPEKAIAIRLSGDCVAVDGAISAVNAEVVRQWEQEK